MRIGAKNFQSFPEVDAPGTPPTIHTAIGLRGFQQTTGRSASLAPHAAASRHTPHALSAPRSRGGTLPSPPRTPPAAPAPVVGPPPERFQIKTPLATEVGGQTRRRVSGVCVCFPNCVRCLRLSQPQKPSGNAGEKLGRVNDGTEP